MNASGVHLLGIRHHGPGSARSVVRALDALCPDAVLVELPADCEPLLTWVGSPRLVPPVALLGHALPQRGAAGARIAAAFMPMAEFSPEWQALRWASDRSVPVHAIDLPLSQVLGRAADDDAGASLGDEGTEPRLRRIIDAHLDPLGALAAAAGHDDTEQWWEDVVEHRGDGPTVFDTVAAAMAEVRSRNVDGSWEGDALTLAREAHMRRTLRRVRSSGARCIVVVCGAWHVPALAEPWPTVGADTAVLRNWSSSHPVGRSGVKVGVSWVPWTHRRLAAATGYGAGVRSPGWYAHVFRHPGDEGVVRWFVDAGRLLRARGMSASPDHLIGATRAADALAALRGRPRAGLAEVRDAAEAVMAGSGGLALVDRDLVVGDAIGAVPDDAPQVPLAADLAAQQRALRLQPTAEQRELELDLRTPGGRSRSVLLHRLRAMRIEWGSLTESRASTGTFRETWDLRWEPELSVRIVEVSPHGLTVETAAASILLDRASASSSLSSLVDVLDEALLADLPEVVEPVVELVEHCAARDPGVADLVAALGPLARALRYGDVRSTDATALRKVVDGIVVRVIAGLVVACRSLDDTQAASMADHLAEAQSALALLDHPSRRGEWPAVLAIIVERPDVHGLVQGRATRLLHDGGVWQHAQVSARLSRALSTGTDPAAAAAFVEGLMADSASLLIHDRPLLDALDAWVSTMQRDVFDATVPLLRRTFGAFAAAERRQLGVLLDSGDPRPVSPFGPLDDRIDADRAAAALVTLRQLMGVPA